jgi:hypothetical protein
VEPIATTAAAVTAYAGQVADAARHGSDQRISGTPMSVVRFFEELAARDREVAAAVTLVTAEPTDRARVDLLASLLATRATADPLLGERLRELVHSVQELQRTRWSIERDLQFAAHQRLVALAVDLGMATAAAGCISAAGRPPTATSGRSPRPRLMRSALPD